MKENEIRDFLKHYELKTKETSIAVKKLIDSKGVIEKEKIDLQSRVFELLEERNELKLLTESKNATITKLQKQIFEVTTYNYFIKTSRAFSKFNLLLSMKQSWHGSVLIETLDTPVANPERHYQPV